jgi:hypothetical protein
MRTYNPALERTLEQLGVMALPRQYERERRFVNLVRQHDVLRSLTDDEYERFIHYMESSSNLVLDVMLKEKAVNEPAQPPPAKKRKARPKAAKKKPAPRPRKRAPAAKRKAK